MSDIYVPGVKSRFNTEKLVEDLMKVERIPRDRAEQTVENLQTEKTYWQDVGRRMTSLRESSRLLYSFQNPFNDRVVFSSDDSILSGTAARDAVEQERSFIVKQVAAADRFLSTPLDENYRIEEGRYSFTVGEDEIAFNFRGGSLKDFTEALNRRGRDKLKASIITVEPGTRSLLVESLVTGAGNRLGFSEAAETLALATGMVDKVDDSRRDIALSPASVRGRSGDVNSSLVSVLDGTLQVAAGGEARITLGQPIQAAGALTISFETATKTKTDADLTTAGPPPGPAVPSAGSASYGGITVENDPSSVPMPQWTPPEPPKRVDDLGVLLLTFSDGTSAALPPVRDSENFNTYQYRLGDIAGSRTIVSMDLVNNNTHRDISIRNVRIFDPDANDGFRPRNAVSVAQDAIISMEGIEVKRPTNTIDDLIPGVTLTAKTASDRQVRLGVEPDRDSIKEAIIDLVGNYNRLMADINVLTRNDDRVIQELTYLTREEQDEMRERLGSFSGDSTLNQFRNNLQRIASAPYPTSADRELSMLAQIGIGTDVRRSGASSGYDASRLRGYLEIDEKALDAALQTKLPAIQQLFGYDTDGDLIIDSGIAHAVDTLARPFVETGGIISLKTGTIDSRISQEQRRIETLDRQLANKEDTLKRQYGQMEGAYNRMEQTATSLDQFSRRANNNN
ncbi:flagellar filament capping protein FliD [Breznakiella homolactica]|uniref:Flagellar hook-associated protein 2 n=1 Tax=Breznakiella homolactica TaxID=2798577 RepID=A0A7T8B8M4_9SPIR|nr:flagellar filament capping protein FliD [Breznakiella homolactica]QQO07532.1 flagellar filament capping protein FliD [Breznakiella homolactica]